MISRLDGRLLASLHTVLLGAYDHPELELLLRTQLNVRLDDISLNAQGMADVVTAVLAWAERRGRIPELLDALVADRPNRREFQRIRDDLARRLKHGAPDSGGRPEPVAPPAVDGDGPRSVDPAGVLSWAQGLARTARSVGLVEVGEAGVCTAIALGPRLVLCPFFAVKDVVAGQEDAGAIRVTFGYGGGTGERPEQGTWELDRDHPLIDQDQDLDAAVLLLGNPLPPDAFGGSLAAQVDAALDAPGAPDAMRLGHSLPEPGEPLHLLAHVLGGPLKLETTSLLGREGDRLFFASDGARRPGRAGAPILDADGRAVAMLQGLIQTGERAGQVYGVRLSAVLERPSVALALAVSKPPPEPRAAMEQMAI